MSSVDNLIQSITDSQQSEKELITSLDNLVSQPSFNVNSSGVISLINSINSHSSSRIAMLRSLSDQASTLQSGVSNSRVDLVSQMTLLNVVEDQLTKARDSISKLQNQNDTKKRMVEVNTYYGKRYEAQSKLMKILISFSSLLLILFILKKKSLLPPLISNYVIGIMIAVGAFFVVRELWDINTRSNMDFEEYDWKYEDPNTYHPTIMQYNKEHLFDFDNPIKTLVGNLGLCVGSDCCANGLYFDKNKQKCTTINTESFIGGIKLQGTNVATIDEDEDKQSNDGILPFSYGSAGSSI